MFVSMVGDGFYFVAVAWQVFRSVGSRRRSPTSDSRGAARCSGVLSGALADRSIDVSS